jgi:predicted phosphodiesterase
MRVFALSDIHVDYDANAKWVGDLSIADYQDDVLILAGDVSDNRRLLGWCLGTLARRFRKLLFVPGNHDLWVIRDDKEKHSLQKFDEVRGAVESSGASMEVFRERGVTIVPLLGWYDYSFGDPSDELRSVWMDYHACRWPLGYGDREVAAHFASFNELHFSIPGDKVITFSHFLPRIDVMPGYIPTANRLLYPILGSSLLEQQLRNVNSQLHVYGHSHVNRDVTIDGVSYINNAFGYPSETLTTSKGLVCIHEC